MMMLKIDLLPNGFPVTRGTHDLPVGDQNFKTRSPNRGLILMIPGQLLVNEHPAHSTPVKGKRKTFGRQPVE